MGHNGNLRAMLVALLFLTIGCTGGDTAETTEPTAAPTTAATTTTTSTTTTSTTTTTTTTTEPPGLVAQTVAYGPEPGDLAKYDFTQAVSIQVSLDDPSGELETSTVETTIDIGGRIWQMTIEGPTEDTVEILRDQRTASATFGFKEGTFTSSEELTDADLAELSGVIAAVVMDRSGRRSDEPGGAPHTYRIGQVPGDSFTTVGPPMPSFDADVGDGWSSSLSDPVVGTLRIESTITGEEELDDGTFVFVIDFEAAVPGLPEELDPETSEAFSQVPESALAALDEAAKVGLEIALELTRYDLIGTIRFDPVQGIIVSAEMEQVMGLDFTMIPTEDSIEVDPLTMSIRAEALETVTLAEFAEAQSYEFDGVVAGIVVDPMTAAEAPLASLIAYPWLEVDSDQISADLEIFQEIRGDILIGWAYGALAGSDGGEVRLHSVAIGGPFRGDPFLAEGLLGYLAGYRPARVTLDGTTAFRATVDGEEWLVWSNQTHLYMIIGPRSAANEIMGTLIRGSDPYRWASGDCFDFRDGYEDAEPYAPFGTLGHRHCIGPHTHQVLHIETVDEGPDAPYPGDELSEQLYETCGRIGRERLGANSFDSTVSMIYYQPDEAEWERGDRYLACVTYLAEPDGAAEIEGSLEGLATEHTMTLEAGVCIKSGAPVPCSTAHTAEIVVVEEYEEGAYPGLEETDRVLEDRCEAALDEYVLDDPRREITAGWWTAFDRDAWEHGERRYACTASLGYDDFYLPIEVTGTFAGDWEIVEEQVDA